MMSGARIDASVPDFLNQNTSEAGPEVALFNGHSDALNFNQNSLSSDLSPIGSYDTRTITKQSFSKLHINSKFGTFTKKTCESIEKFHSEINGLDQDEDAVPTDNGVSLSSALEHVDSSSTPNGVSAKEEFPKFGKRGSDTSSNGAALNQVSNLQDEVEQLRIQLNDALAERDQGVAALRAYEELLKRINESNAKQKGSSASSLGSGSSSQKDGNVADVDRLKKKNSMLEKTVDNLEQTVQDTMARMNEVKDVNQELKIVLTDQQDMLAQYKSTIEQKSFEYRDLLSKHEAHIDALVTEHKRDKALLEKQITLLRAEAHMKSLDNERLASECRIKGEQLARMTEMLNELRQAY